MPIRLYHYGILSSHPDFNTPILRDQYHDKSNSLLSIILETLPNN